jgi:hypothetical protein
VKEDWCGDGYLGLCILLAGLLLGVGKLVSYQHFTRRLLIVALRCEILEADCERSRVCVRSGCHFGW